MAEGVRLTHPELRSCVYTLIHQGRPLRMPHRCTVCHQIHHHKTYHLGLDALGSVVVSPVVYERLKEAGLDGLKAAGSVSNPEPQQVGIGGPPLPLTVVSRESRRK